MPWPLDHFDAEGWLKKRRADCEGLLLDSFRDSIDVEIESLAEAAQLFFRGLYPVESPYLAWGEVKVLPWSDAYSRSEDEAAPPISISTELDRIAHELLQAASGPGRPSMLTYMCASLSTTQLKTQGLAVELLLTLDDLINHLDRAQYLEAVLLMSESHKYVSEMTIQAERLLAPTMALRGADARHKKTRELKLGDRRIQARQFCKQAQRLSRACRCGDRESTGTRDQTQSPTRAEDHLRLVKRVDGCRHTGTRAEVRTTSPGMRIFFSRPAPDKVLSKRTCARDEREKNVQRLVESCNHRALARGKELRQPMADHGEALHPDFAGERGRIRTRASVREQRPTPRRQQWYFPPRPQTRDLSLDLLPIRTHADRRSHADTSAR